ncbi:hypothetical protein [Streptomyces sp. NPDC058683]|uniref:hypothetical protein n=1 Tax=Streptomyces sp. NPDC058683 TaxID=3346597 RepID=UPI003669F477
MRAAVLRGGTVEARIVDDPVPGPGQLLVRSLACGIRASDLHFMDHPEAGADDDSGMSTYDQDVDIVIQFGGGPSMADWDEAFEAVPSGGLGVGPLLGGTVGLDEVPAALDAARDANGPARIVVVP